MTGIFVRIQRDGPDGPSRPVALDEMTDAELDSLDALLVRQDPQRAWGWLNAHARWRRDHRHEGSPTPQEGARDA